jgi:hypothetical protein
VSSYVDDLLHAYSKFVALPWQRNLAPPQRVWMAVYPPENERRLRLWVPEFGTETDRQGHPWALVDITTTFEIWMASHRYRDAYFEDPELLETALPAFFDHLVDDVRIRLAEHPDPDGRDAVRPGSSREGVRAGECGERCRRRSVAGLLPGRAQRPQLPAVGCP